MKKRIQPDFGYKDIKPDIPLQKRILLLMERIHLGGYLWPYCDDATVKACIERGLIKRSRTRLYGRGRQARNKFVPLVLAPQPEVKRVPQPYAKRLAAMDEAGLRRRVAPNIPKPSK